MSRKMTRTGRHIASGTHTRIQAVTNTTCPICDQPVDKKEADRLYGPTGAFCWVHTECLKKHEEAQNGK